MKIFIVMLSIPYEGYSLDDMRVFDSQDVADAYCELRNDGLEYGLFEIIETVVET